MNLIIIDDEPHTREAITQLVQLYYPQARVSGAFSGIKKAVDAMREQPPDVLLLDIELGAERGFDLLQYFPRPPFKVIFITAYQQYAVDAFRFSALDYLLKPIDPDLLVQALDKAAGLTSLEKLAAGIEVFAQHVTGTDKKEKRIMLKTAGEIHLVNITDIMYCGAEHSYTVFYLADKIRIMVSTTLGDYEDLLQHYGFVRIHQSYLVNMDYISRYEKAEGGNVILKDRTSLPVSTRRKELLLQQLSKL